MRIFLSFLLSIIIYSSILFFFFYFITQHKITKPQIVYVHQVIANIKKKKVIKKPIVKPQPKAQPKAQPKPKKKPQKIKTKDEFSKGGKDIKFDDIFSNVEENIPTTKIKQKKQKNMTKKIGDVNLKEVKKTLSHLQTAVTISNTIGSSNDLNYIQNELSRVWNNIETQDGDFIKVQVNILNNQINVVVIATNLDTIRLNQFLTQIRNIDISKVKNLNAVINFKSKLKE